MSIATPTATASGADERRSNQALVVLLIVPIALVNAFGFLLPVLNLLRMSFYEVEPTGAMREVYTLARAQGLGEKDIGPLCVEWLRKCGGVLEHPAHSRLWQACNLPLPGESDGGLWTIAVWQSWWGFPMGIKRTWLCFHGISKRDIHTPLRLRGQGADRGLWATGSKSWRDRTTDEFADWLVDAARRCRIVDPLALAGCQPSQPIS